MLTKGKMSCVFCVGVLVLVGGKWQGVGCLGFFYFVWGVLYWGFFSGQTTHVV